MSENNYISLFWGIIELFGHKILAGQIGEQEIGGEIFIRVDVPAIDDQKAFTKFLGKGAIYAITPCDDSTARAAISGLRAEPVEIWRLDIPRLQEPESNEESD